MKYLISGLLLGFSYVAPIGTQNLFMINTALTQPKARTYITALIIMFFDISLAIGCFYGIGALMSQSFWLQFGILGVGSLIVIWIGFSIFRSKETLDTGENVNIPIGKVISTACVVTWFNPQAIIDGSMMLGAFKATMPHDQGLIFILGVSIASATWWLFVATAGNLFNNKVNDKVLRIINIVCGSIIIFYGLKLFISFIKMIPNI